MDDKQPRDHRGRYFLLNADPNTTEYNLLEATAFTAQDGVTLPPAMNEKYPWMNTQALVTAYVFNGDEKCHALEADFPDMDCIAALTRDAKGKISQEGDIGGLLGHVPLLQFLVKHSAIPLKEKGQYLDMLDFVIYGGEGPSTVD